MGGSPGWPLDIHLRCASGTMLYKKFWCVSDRSLMRANLQHRQRLENMWAMFLY